MRRKRQESGPFPGHADRADAGRRLAAALERYRTAPSLLVLGLPRGGVPVAAEVARALRAPLDVVLVRKVGHPSQPELAAGAVASIAGVPAVVRNEDVMDAWRRQAGRQADTLFEQSLARQQTALHERAGLYRPYRTPQQVPGRTVIVVDDGLATGATMRAALAAVRQLGPRLLVAAAPVACGTATVLLPGEADDVVVPWSGTGLESVGQAYARFGQTPDAEVQRLLQSFS